MRLASRLTFLVACLPHLAAADSFDLSEAYKAARGRSETIGIRKQQRAAAEEEDSNTWSRIKPQVSLHATGALQGEKTIMTATGETDVFRPRFGEAGAALTQPLFRRGTFDAHAAGQAGIAASDASRARSEEELMIDVVTVYIAVLEAREQVKLANDAVARSQTELQITQARVKAGGGLKTAEQLAQIEVDRAKLGVVRAGREVDVQSVAFERLVGIAPPADLTPPPAAAVPAVEECLRQATHRNDAKATRLLVEQARERESSLHGRLWPTLDAQATFNYYSYFFPLGTNVTEWTARLVLTVPLYQGGSEYSDIHQAEIRSSIADLETAQRDKDIVAEVKSAAIRLAAAQAAAAVIDEQARAAKDHYELITTQFKVGAVTFLDVANAQGVLTDAERQRSSSRYETELAKYQLLFASGLLKL